MWVWELKYDEFIDKETTSNEEHLNGNNMPDNSQNTHCLLLDVWKPSLSVAGSTVWNPLSDDLRDPSVDSEHFRQTHAFSGYYGTLVQQGCFTNVKRVLYKLTFSYLLT